VLVYRGGKDLKRSITLLALLIMAGISDVSAEEKIAPYVNPSMIEERNLTFNMEQRVSGNGFFATYRHSRMSDVIGTQGRLFNGVEAMNNAHGSGKLDTDSIMCLGSSYINRTWDNGAYDEDGEVIDYEEGTTSIYQLKEDNKATYWPIAMGIGSQYYALNPIIFNSLINERDWIKNRNGLNSLSHKVEQAHGLDKRIDLYSDAEINSIKVEDDLINGKAQLRALQLAGIPLDEVPEESDSEGIQVLGFAMKAWKKPLIEMNEVYLGSFHIGSNMTQYTYSEEEEIDDEWLPCCSKGILDIDLMEPTRVIM
jgi:hypothetical protein